MTRPVTDPRVPRPTPDPLRHQGPGKSMFCVHCGNRFMVVGKVPKGQLVGCPYCHTEQEPDI